MMVIHGYGASAGVPGRPGGRVGKIAVVPILSVMVLLLLASLLPGCILHDDERGPGSSTELPARAGTWPQYRLEPTHQGVAPTGTTVGPGIGLFWNTSALAMGTYTASKSSPAVDIDRVYIGVDDGRLYALDKFNGSVIWSYRTHRYDDEMKQTDPAHHGIHGSPAVDGANVYIGDYDGYMYAINKSSGKLVWERKLGGSIGASPVLYRGQLLTAVEFPEPNGKVFVQNAADGSIVYETGYLGNHPHSSVTVDTDGGRFFVGANNGCFYCFDIENGQELWMFQCGGEIKSTAAVHGDTVYVTSWDMKLHALWIGNGTERFSFSTGGRSMSSPAYHDGRIFFGSHDGRSYCIDAGSGEKQWSFDTGRMITSSPTVVRETGVVLIGSKDERVYMLDIDNGHELWSCKLNGAVTSVPVATGNALYVNDDSGMLWCFTMP